MKLAGHTYLVPGILDVDGGVPVMLANALGGIGENAGFWAWRDSAWMLQWTTGYGTGVLWDVPSPDGTRFLVWRGFDRLPDKTLAFVFAEVGPPGIVHLDTLAHVLPSAEVYAAAVTGRCRWAAFSEHRDSSMLRVFASCDLEGWREVGTGGAANYGVGMAPVNDTTALMVWMGSNVPVRWSLIRGDSLDPSAEVPGVGARATLPRLRPRPSGGMWVGWATDAPHINVMTYRSGLWSAAEILTCNYPGPSPPQSFSSVWIDLSRDDAEYPAIVLEAYSSRGTGSVICACMPTDSGFASPEPVPGSEQGEWPAIARDDNGDVWVAWWGFNGAFWTHTYTNVTVTRTVTTSESLGPHLSWTLSGPAPESWWAVLRSRNNGEFAVAARLRAGRDTVLTWGDTPAPGDTLLRYRLRRECVDRRFEVSSDEVIWRREIPEGMPEIRLGSPVPNPGGKQTMLRFELSGGGVVDAAVFDLFGHRVRTLLSGLPHAPGTHAIAWNGLDDEGRHVPSGLYFVRVSLPQSAATARLIWIRGR